MGTGVILSCEGCGKTFRLRPSADTQRPCPDCGAVLGTPRARQAPGSEETSPKRARVPQDSETRQQANRVLATAKMTLLQIRVLLILPAVLGGLLFVLGLVSGRVEGLFLLLTGGIAVAASVAAILVLRQPVLATLINAVLATPLGVVSALALATGRIDLMGCLGLLVAVASWVAVPMALTTQRLTRRYPDLFAARALRGESTGRHAEQAAREATRRLKRNLLVGGGVLLLVVGLPLLLVAWKGGPPAYERPGTRTTSPT